MGRITTDLVDQRKERKENRECRAAVRATAAFAGFPAGLPPKVGYTILMVKTSTVVALVCLSMIVLVRAADPSLDSSACGQFPKLYKDIVWTWMQKNLVDPESAKVEWQGEPKCTDLGQNGNHDYGWLINFTVNSRNRFGVYTGKQQHGVLIRNGEVVKGIGFGY